MKHKRRFTNEAIIEALKKSLGVYAEAARMLGCDRSTICKAVKERPAIGKALEDILESRVDLAESELYKAAHEGKAWAIKFLLQSSHGSKRGFGNTQKIELQHSAVENIPEETLENIIKELNGDNN